MSKKQKTITEEEIRGAIRAFQRAGGLIKVLPDEDTPPRNLVGAKYAAYEPVVEHLQIG